MVLLPELQLSEQQDARIGKNLFEGPEEKPRKITTQTKQ